MRVLLAQSAPVPDDPADPALTTVAEHARAADAAVIVGYVERLDGGGVANSVACFDRDGRQAGTYRKTHLFGHESEVFSPGDDLLVVELAGRRVAPLVCFDVEFPEPARAVARAGAELLVTVAANMDPYGPDHDLAVRARALDNRLPHVYVNRVGSEYGLDFVGGSAVVAADGRALVRLGGEAAERAADVDLESRPESAVDYLRLVRPALPVSDLTITTTTQGATR